ncbi:MAG TPA: WXG100 family type VII secretion target [Actinomycetaceae bacterium]|nr:WXG100 family type VII secretion target [Actinomycetaceae bacterium]
MKYSVDSAAVALAATRARATSAAIHSEVTAMMAHLLALQSSWTGSASIAFDELARRWQLVQVQVETSLDQISVALDSAAATYAETESAAARMFAA